MTEHHTIDTMDRQEQTHFLTFIWGQGAVIQRRNLEPNHTHVHLIRDNCRVIYSRIAFYLSILKSFMTFLESNARNFYLMSLLRQITTAISVEDPSISLVK